MKAALAALLMALAGPAAADCPAFDRFVDFGIIDDEGRLYRGGPVVRAEDFDGTPLLATDATVCADVPDLLMDGRGNPIPVVTKIAYDRRKTVPALGWIEVAASADVLSVAEGFAVQHSDRLALPEATQIRGEDHLCAQTPDTHLSCQVISPYDTAVPLEVFCEDEHCIANAIAMTERLMITASWPSAGVTPESITARISEIAAFLAPISSGL